MVVGMSRPGASKTSPATSCPSSPATARTPRCEAGNPPLPSLGSAAPTMVIPRDKAMSRSRSSSRSRGPPRLKLITWAFSSSANCSAFATVKLLQKAAASPDAAACQQARRARNFAWGAIPAIPMPSSARAAMMPAIAVPCHSATSWRPSTKFRATATCPVRSGWLTSTPVSISATRTRLPVVILCSSPRCQSLALGCSGYNGSRRQHTEQLHLLRRFDARIQRQFFHDLR